MQENLTENTIVMKDVTRMEDKIEEVLKDMWLTAHSQYEEGITDISIALKRILRITSNSNQPIILKITEVVEKMKKKIWSSLNEYLNEANIPQERIQLLNLMAENECRICDELLVEFNNIGDK